MEEEERTRRRSSSSRSGSIPELCQKCLSGEKDILDTVQLQTIVVINPTHTLCTAN